MLVYTWALLKAFVDARSLSIQYVDLSDSYYLIAIDGPFQLQYNMPKDSGADQTDFDNNYKSAGNKQLVPDTDPRANSDRFKAACQGFTGTATAGQSTNIDYTLSATRYLIGVSVILKNHIFGDKITFRVVHPQYGVVDEFAIDWNVSEDVQDQGKFEFPLRGKIPSGLKVRLVYTSVGQNNVSVACNLILHKKT